MNVFGQTFCDFMFTTRSMITGQCHHWTPERKIQSSKYNCNKILKVPLVATTVGGMAGRLREEVDRGEHR